MRLAHFFDEVAQAAFGTEWTSGTRPSKPSTTRTALTASEERAALVLDDLSFALQSGRIQERSCLTYLHHKRGLDLRR
jgi:hypothetical protein